MANESDTRIKILWQIRDRIALQQPICPKNRDEERFGYGLTSALHEIDVMIMEAKGLQEINNGN